MRPAPPARERLKEAAGEVVLLAAVLAVFNAVHGVVATDADIAAANASTLQGVERALHLDVELDLNRWLVDHPALITPAVVVYRLYYVVLLGVLVWVFLRHSGVYRHVRRVFVALCGFALLVYWVAPMSPPRFALRGVVDVVAENDLFGSHAFATASSYTAMPSVHVAWSAWAAYAAWCALRDQHPRAALAVWAFPALMVAVVFTTGNHYVLDVVGSVLVLALAIEVADVWDGADASRSRRPRPARVPAPPER